MFREAHYLVTHMSPRHLSLDGRVGTTMKGSKGIQDLPYAEARLHQVC
jgi:hypothetical protein